MNIELFKNLNIFKNIFSEDENNRILNVYKMCNLHLTGYSLYYPNVLLKNNNKLILPVLEKTMSLNCGSIYEEENMKYNYTSNKILYTNTSPLFFFIYNTDNYFHFLYDTLPYLISYLNLKEEIPNIKLLMQYPNPQKKKFYPFVIEFLELLNIEKKDIVIANIETNYECVYISTSYTHDFDSNLPPRKEIYDLYKNIVNNVKKNNNIETPEKIYISRRTWLHNDFSNIGTNYTTRRKLINEDELVEKLLKDNYVEVFTEKLTTIEKILYFSNATHVVGAIGGGISNVLFSRPSTYLKAIISPTFLDINKRFKFSLDHVNVEYDINTQHYENTDFKTYMRVKIKEKKIIGEITKINNNKITIAYTNESCVGWNNQSKYQNITLNIGEIEKIDNGLNSPWIYNDNISNISNINTEELYIYYSELDIPIKLKNGTNLFENIFLFNLDKKIKSTFLCDMNYKKIDKINYNNYIYINNISFLFYSNNQEKAFTHYIKEFLLRLDYILKLKKNNINVKIVIPNNFYYSYTEYIFEKLNLKNDLFLLNDKTLYKFQKIIYLPQNDNFNEISDQEINSLNIIRNLLNIEKNLHPFKRIYIARDDINNYNYGCFNIGNQRRILNEIELINNLKRLNFEIITLGNKQLLDKSSILNNAEIIITQSGGSSLNLLFSNSPKKLLIISNEFPVFVKYFENIINNSKIISNTYTDYKLLKFKTIVNHDNENSTNGSFNVNIEEINSFIHV